MIVNTTTMAVKNSPELTSFLSSIMKHKGAKTTNRPPTNSLSLFTFTFSFSSFDAVLYPAISMSPLPDNTMIPNTTRNDAMIICTIIFINQTVFSKFKISPFLNYIRKGSQKSQLFCTFVANISKVYENKDSNNTGRHRGSPI